MLIVPEPAYVNEGGGWPGAINMLIVPEPVFPYYWRLSRAEVVVVAAGRGCSGVFWNVGELSGGRANFPSNSPLPACPRTLRPRSLPLPLPLPFVHGLCDRAHFPLPLVRGLVLVLSLSMAPAPTCPLTLV